MQSLNPTQLQPPSSILKTAADQVRGGAPGVDPSASEATPPSGKKNIEQRTSFDSKRLLQRTFNVDINDPEQPLLLDTEVPGSSSASKSHHKSDNLATIHSAVSSTSSQQNPGKNSSSSHQKWNITAGQKGQDFGQKSQKTDPNNSENNPASGKGSPLPSGVIPSGLRSRSPQINSGWL